MSVKLKGSYNFKWNATILDCFSTANLSRDPSNQIVIETIGVVVS